MADVFLKALNRVLPGGNPGYQLQAPAFFAANGLFAIGPQVIAPAATPTPNALLGPWIKMTFTANTVVAFQIPSNVPAGYSWQFAITIINTSGGALTNITFVAAYKAAALTFPADTKNRTYVFNTDGTNAWEVVQTAADAAN